MERRQPQPPGGRKIGAAGAGRQIHDEASRPQRRQHRLGEHHRRDGIHHRIKRRGHPGQCRQRDAAQPQTFGQRPLRRAAGRNGHTEGSDS